MDFKWSKRTFDLKTLINRYSSHLPIIVKVTEGFYGIDDEDIHTFSTDDVFRLTHVNQQPRVIVKDEIGRHISLPIYRPFRFHVISGNDQKGEAKPLAELVAGLHRGDRIIAEDDNIDFWVGMNKKMTEQLGVLTFVAEYPERYLVGNTINVVEIEEEPTVIPVYASVKIVIVEGLMDGSTQKYDDITQQLAHKSRNFANHQVDGNLEIMLFEGKVSDYKDYDYVKPNNILRTNFNKTKDGYTIPNTSTDGNETKAMDTSQNRETSYQKLLPAIALKPKSTCEIPPPVQKGCAAANYQNPTKDGYTIPYTSTDGNETKAEDASKNRQMYYQKLPPAIALKPKSTCEIPPPVQKGFAAANYQNPTKDGQSTSLSSADQKQSQGRFTPRPKRFTSLRSLPGATAKSRVPFPQPHSNGIPAPPRTTSDGYTIPNTSTDGNETKAMDTSQNRETSYQKLLPAIALKPKSTCEIPPPVQKGCAAANYQNPTKDGYTIPYTSTDGNETKAEDASKNRQMYYQKLPPAIALKPKSTCEIPPPVQKGFAAANYQNPTKDDQSTSLSSADQKQSQGRFTPRPKRFTSLRSLPGATAKSRVPFPQPHSNGIPAPPRTTSDGYTIPYTSTDGNETKAEDASKNRQTYYQKSLPGATAKSRVPFLQPHSNGIPAPPRTTSVKQGKSEQANISRSSLSPAAARDLCFRELHTRLKHMSVISDISSSDQTSDQAGNIYEEIDEKCYTIKQGVSSRSLSKSSAVSQQPIPSQKQQEAVSTADRLITWHVKDMTISQVGELLDEIHLSKYKDLFLENHVDGALLCDIPHEALVGEFGFTRLHALKLTKYVNENWRPRLI